jgi:hypothetical protein
VHPNNVYLRWEYQKEKGEEKRRRKKREKLRGEFLMNIML